MRAKRTASVTLASSDRPEPALRTFGRILATCIGVLMALVVTIAAILFAFAPLAATGLFVTSAATSPARVP